MQGARRGEAKVRTMSPELWTAVGSIGSAVVIAATAAAALVQLRHMRAGNATNVILALRSNFSDPIFTKANELLRGDAIARAMEDPRYRMFITDKAPAPSEEARELHRALRHVANWYEVLGSMVLQRVVTMPTVADNYANVVDRDWKLCEPQIIYMRADRNDQSVYEGFEYLTTISRKWIHDHPSVYPRGVPRLNVTNAYPLNEG